MVAGEGVPVDTELGPQQPRLPHPEQQRHSVGQAVSPGVKDGGPRLSWEVELPAGPGGSGGGDC